MITIIDFSGELLGYQCSRIAAAVGTSSFDLLRPQLWADADLPHVAQIERAVESLPLSDFEWDQRIVIVPPKDGVMATLLTAHVYYKKGNRFFYVAWCENSETVFVVDLRSLADHY